MRSSIILMLLVAGCPDNSGNNKSGCPAPFMVCGSVCTAVNFDPTNCGSCGNACAAGQACRAGACMTTTCPSGVLCGSTCTDTGSDNANCGSCGMSCPAGQRCSAGSCDSTCGGGFADCLTYCADTANDSQNCGACGKVCPAGQRCASGACTASCPTNRASCNGGCVDLQTDNANCGACGTVCAAGESCITGACACGITGLTLGWLTSCGLRSDGKVVCSGAFNYGCWDSQTPSGLGTGCNTNFPVGTLASWVVPGLNAPTAIDAGREYMCALNSDGTVWCLGSNKDGRLGNGEAVPSPKAAPVQVMASPAAAPVPLTGVKQISVGAAHVCALKTNGEVWCWGRGNNGELGNNGGSSSVATPATLTGVTGIQKVVAGEAHSCALAGDNTLWCWGANNYFQLGINNNTSPQLTPQHVVGIDNVTDVVTEFDTTCAIRNDKTLWCWGRNQQSQAGYPENTLQLVPSPTPVPLADVAQVSMGITHACARQSTGKVFCWGHNGQGEIGNGTRDSNTNGFNSGTSDPLPSPVIDANSMPITAKSIAMSHGHSCAVVGANDHPVCWGNNKKGQSGLLVPFSTVARPIASCGY
jgi:hypothetical protein